MASYRRRQAEKQDLAAWHERTTNMAADHAVEKSKKLLDNIGDTPIGATKKPEDEIVAESGAALQAEADDPQVALNYWQTQLDNAPGRTDSAKKLRLLNMAAELAKLYRKYQAQGKV